MAANLDKAKIPDLGPSGVPEPITSNNGKPKPITPAEQLIPAVIAAGISFWVVK